MEENKFVFTLLQFYFNCNQANHFPTTERNGKVK